MSKQRTGFRAWFYLRMGYTIYWAFLIMGINTVTVTYYLAIDKAPVLKEIFPTFVHYSIILVIIAVPVLILTGFIHYKKIPGYKSEAEVTTEQNPYVYKLPPGFWLHVIMPYFRLQSNLLLKLSSNEKLTEKELEEMKTLQEKMDVLLKGGFVGETSRLKNVEDRNI